MLSKTTKLSAGKQTISAMFAKLSNIRDSSLNLTATAQRHLAAKSITKNKITLHSHLQDRVCEAIAVKKKKEKKSKSKSKFFPELPKSKSAHKVTIFTPKSVSVGQKVTIFTPKKSKFWYITIFAPKISFSAIKK